jgi:Mn-dependent DtxR family transcriptional regulator
MTELETYMRQVKEPVSIKQVQAHFNLPYSAAKQRLANLHRKGTISRVDKGIYALGILDEAPPIYMRVLGVIEAKGKVRNYNIANYLGITLAQVQAAINYLNKEAKLVQRDQNGMYEVTK